MGRPIHTYSSQVRLSQAFVEWSLIIEDRLDGGGSQSRSFSQLMACKCSGSAQRVPTGMSVIVRAWRVGMWN